MPGTRLYLCRGKGGSMKAVHVIVVIVCLLFFAGSAKSQTPFTGLVGGGAKNSGNAVENEAETGQATEAETIADPLESWNRIVFEFNDRLYFWLMKPGARVYNTVVPEPARIGINNFFRNLEMPVRFVNSVLQGEPKSAGIELVRFVLNSSVGVGGMVDVMKQNPNFQPQEKDTGQTLGKYGIGNGMYIVWPFLGPSTIRETVGFVGDGFLTPVDYITPVEDMLGVNAYDYFNKISLHIGEYEDFKEAAIDPYLAIKDAYLQHRKYLLGR